MPAEHGVERWGSHAPTLRHSLDWWAVTSMNGFCIDTVNSLCANPVLAKIVDELRKL